MRSVFSVEEAAAKIKGKYNGPPKQTSITSSDVMNSLLSSVPAKKPESAAGPTNRTSLKPS